MLGPIAIQRQMIVEAKATLAQHNLHGWRFRFNTNKRRRGVCRYAERSVEVSVGVCLEGIEAVRKVLAHEIAHALVGHGHGHDAVWQRKSLELGGGAERCGMTMLIEAPYVGKCPGDHVHKRFKAPRGNRRQSCSACCSGFNEAYLIVWERTR